MGRPLLAARTLGVASLMTGCTSGNLVPPPSIEYCFDVEPATALVYNASYGSARDYVPLDQNGCARLEVYSEVYVTAPGFCEELVYLQDLAGEPIQLSLSPAPCTDLGVPPPPPDLGTGGDLGLPGDQGSLDQGPMNAADIGETDGATPSDGG